MKPGLTDADEYAPLLVRESEVARRLGISVNTVRRMRRRGEGPPSQPFGRLIRYRWTDVERWMDRRSAA